jgi:hypothetical protein
MTITIALADADGGTELVAVHEGLPPGLSPPPPRCSLTKSDPTSSPL